MSKLLSELDRIVSMAGDLPTVPIVAHKVLELAGDERTSAGEMGRIIACDPALGARILKIANSSFYSCSRHVLSIDQAIVMIGYDALRAIVVAASVKEIYKPFGLAEKILWEHSLGAAIAARNICKKIRTGLADEAFLAGLLHDVGKVIMSRFNRDAYSDLIALCYNHENFEFSDLEQEYFPFSHAELGACVLKKWNIPESLIYAVMQHHKCDQLDPAADQDSNDLALITSFADLCCKKLGLGEREPKADKDLVNSLTAQKLELDQQTIDLLLLDIEADFLDAKEGF